MPELPEVQTTVNGLKKVLPGLKILDVWTDLAVKKPSLRHFDDTIKNLNFFNIFKKEVIGSKVVSAERRAKNILINLSNEKTILIHLKMTGHLLYGKYKKTTAMAGQVKNEWEPAEDGPLNDPYNRFIHVVFSFSNGKHLAFCDSRKFGKVTLIKEGELKTTKHLKDIGPEPLDRNFDLKKFKNRIKERPTGRIKNVLMDQNIIAGIGNIYSDEMLWMSGIHPEEKVRNITDEKFKKMFDAMKEVLKKGISLGGDSMSDYRNILGKRGEFQLHHRAYQRKGEKCSKPGCKGVIMRIVVGGRSAHFCPVHQKLWKH